MKGTMKKVLSFALVIALTAGIAIGGTMAYLTDRDSKVNVFTIGDVSIDLNEDFEQGATLIPGVKIEKVPTITNTGKNDAWVWMSYAIPSVLDNEDASLNVIHVNTPGAYWYGYHTNPTYIASAGLTEAVDETDTWIVDYAVAKDVEIDGVKYNVYTHLYKGAIIPGETTNPGMSTVYLDSHVDIDPNGDWYHVEKGVAEKLEWNSGIDGNPVIYVSAYAIQTEGFNTVEEAYAAYNTQWTTDEGVNNGLEYGDILTLENMTAEDVENSDYHTHTTSSGRVNAAGISSTDDGIIKDRVVLDTSNDEYTFRALYINGLTEDLYVKSCVLDGTYAMNVTVAKENGDYIEDVNLICEDTAFMGWTSFSGFENATFTNCTFKMNSIGTQNHVRTYDNATFENCEFQGTLDIVEDGSVTLINCTYNGVAITAENVESYFPGVTVTVE